MNLNKLLVVGALSFSALLIGGCSSSNTQSKETNSSAVSVKRVNPEEKNAQNLVKIINDHPLNYKMIADDQERYTAAASSVQDAEAINISHAQDTIMPAPSKAKYLTTLAEKYSMNDGEFASLKDLAGDPLSYEKQLKGDHRPQPEIKNDSRRGEVWKNITLLYGTLHDAKVSKDVDDKPTIVATRTVHYQTKNSSEKTVSKKITVQAYEGQGKNKIKRAKIVE